MAIVHYLCAGSGAKGLKTEIGEQTGRSRCLRVTLGNTMSCSAQEAVEELLTKQRSDIKLLREAEAKVRSKQNAFRIRFGRSFRRADVFLEGCALGAGG